MESKEQSKRTAEDPTEVVRERKIPKTTEGDIIVQKEEVMLIGGHVSIAKGFPQALQEGQRVGAKALAFFIGSQKRWNSPPLNLKDVQTFKSSLRSSPYRPRDILVHGSYLLNLAAPKDSPMHSKSLGLIRNEVERVATLRLERYVFHPGSTKGEISDEEGITNVANALEETIQATRDSASNVTILVECTAGQGHTLGRTLGQLKGILSQVTTRERVGIYLDTYHLWAAGYDLSSAESCDRFFREFEEKIGFENLKGFHLNDSKGKLESRVDRHANIGKGLMGLECFRYILNDSRFKGIPLVLETAGPYDEEIRLLESLIKKT